MLANIHHASLTTSDGERLSAFYTGFFGFTLALKTEWDGNNALADAIWGITGTSVKMWMLKRGTSFLEIFEFRTPPAKRSDDRQISTAGYTHMALLSDDIHGDYGRLSASGIAFTCPPQDVPGLCIATYLRDPDGNLIELLQPHPGSPFLP
jgi:catechol 2,3-dioxygenase-like lactoylglutathione lyase family enzyme